MKRFILVFLCLSLLSLLIIPVFADERVLSPAGSLRTINPSSQIPYTFVFTSSFTSIPSGASYHGSQITFGSVTFGGSVYSPASIMINYYTADDVNYVSDVVLNNSVVLYSQSNLGKTFVITDFGSSNLSGLSGSILSSLEAPFYGDVSDGVRSSIDFTGSVLRNLVISPAVIVLVGLSIAMLVVLPWGISKIKSLIKGY